MVFGCVLASSGVGCDGLPGDKVKTTPVPPAKTTHTITETSLNTIELTEDAVRRLGIETQAVVERSLPRFRTYGAEIVLPAGASVMVSAPVAGR